MNQPTIFCCVRYTAELIPGPVNNTLLSIFSSCPSEILYFTYLYITTSYKNQPIFTPKSPQTTPTSFQIIKTHLPHHSRLHTHARLPRKPRTPARPLPPEQIRRRQGIPAQIRLSLKRHEAHHTPAKDAGNTGLRPG